MKPQPTIWKAYNPLTRHYEEIDPDEAELLPGQTMLRMFWCQSAGRYLTVPGASLYAIDADSNLVLLAD